MIYLIDQAYRPCEPEGAHVNHLSKDNTAITFFYKTKKVKGHYCAKATLKKGHFVKLGGGGGMCPECLNPNFTKKCYK